MGLHPSAPVTALREAFACVRHLLRRSKEPLAGSIFPLAGGDSLRWTIHNPEIPFLLGSWGEKTLRACLPFISEVKVGGSANPDAAAWMRGLIDRHASAAGREAEEIGVVMGAVTVVDEDAAAARTLARREVALYLPIVAALDPTVTIEPDRLAGMQAAADGYDFDAAARFISDELLAKFALASSPESMAEQAASLFAAGASRVEFGTPHGLSAESGLRLLGERVLPLLRQTMA